MINFNNKIELERFSSAFTLSDMEIFIFPELFYSLILANIMSPIIWEWKNNQKFENINKKSFNFKINKIKQYIMDNFSFNLDLETWGLTDKNIEIQRFKDIINPEVLKKSNALFGYEGDKYYFDNNIRKHFGLDKYNTNTIPYWKTETIESMKAFSLKDEYQTGAGECVSLAALYAAALFIVGEIPLENIYLMATPLHSQNFIDISSGFLTNNRRIVTKNMWFNGTTLTAKARRALENENITIVSHISGYIHEIYKEATIDTNRYDNFKKKISSFLKEEISNESFRNFLRQSSHFQKEFQYVYHKNGHKFYIPLEKIYQYEHSSKNKFSDKSFSVLLSEIDMEEFFHCQIKDRIILNDFENNLFCKCFEKQSEIFKEYKNFLITIPRFPLSCEKTFLKSEILKINVSQSREEIFNYILEESKTNLLALYSLYTYRQMDMIDWQPFIYAAINRNPVSLLEFEKKDINQVFSMISDLSSDSIYDKVRLAQPDEAWNYKSADGIEKAFIFANYLKNIAKIKEKIKLKIENYKVSLSFAAKEYNFVSKKKLKKDIII